MTYSAYGELLTEKVSGFGYNGEYYDAATGMLNLRARQYEPAQARFSQRDSLKGWSTDPRSLNAYLYCQNDAINFFDASGAAMMAVNMTDGGGGTGRTTAAKIANAAQIQAAVSRVGVIEANLSASAAAKAANAHALTQAQVSSMSDPATARHKARLNRAQAQATTPTVKDNSFLRSTKGGACMTQEEYDAGAEIYGPQLSSSTPSATPRPTPKPTPQPGPTPSLMSASPKSRQRWKKFLASVRYLKQSVEALSLGDYSGEDPTLLSIAGSVALGIANFDLPLDARDALYDVTHFDELERPWLRLGIDIIAFIPVIGAFKYVDDLAYLAKYSDDIADIAKYSDDAFDYVRRSDDVADLVDGFGDGTKHLDDMSDAAKQLDNASDAIRQADRITDIANEIHDAERVGSALKSDKFHRAASYLSAEQLSSGSVFSIVGGDMKQYTLLQVQGELDDMKGIYEYILDSSGKVTHQMFIPNGIITGFPNQ